MTDRDRDRDRLIELLCNEFSNADVDWVREKIAKIADCFIANGVTVNEWRPASEPPKESGKYLVIRNFCDGHEWQEVCRFATNLQKVDKYDFKGKKRAGWYKYDDGKFFEISTVAHWMPLPEPPKGETE